MPPLPKPDHQRRNARARVGQQRLPAEGRQGKPPAWPLDTKPTAALRSLWNDYWTKPQAVVWEAIGCERVVAMLCLFEDQINNGSTVATVLTRHGQLQDRLGLTPKAMRALLWEIDSEPTPVAATSNAIDTYRAMLDGPN